MRVSGREEVDEVEWENGSYKNKCEELKKK